MCGLNCIINFDESNVTDKQINNMNNLIIHRGPDNQSIYNDKNFGFGHCRLSIIDLTKKANQPFHSDDNRFLIIYNGEVYNYLELKNKLVNVGFVFKTNSDTEVIINSYIHWGDRCVKMFNGMFAFLIWDKKKRQLFGARDRFGIKPLYFYRSNEKMIISSEIKPILSMMNSVSIDYNSLTEYFLFQNYLKNKTLFKDIFLFEKGVFFYIKDRKIIKKKYFSHQNNIFSAKTNNLNFEKLIMNAVNKSMISDVPIGSYLSSGLDSSLITYFASQKTKNINTFTCGFLTDDKISKHFDESKDARQISILLSTSHHEIKVQHHNLEQIIKRISFIMEEPRLGASIPNYVIANLVKKYNKVVLSGAGGDELFGGYPWRYKPSFKSKNKNEFIELYFKQNFRFDQKYIQELLEPINSSINFTETKANFYSFFDFLEKKPSLENFISSCLLFDLEYFLEGYCIMEDKISMSCSLETRLPFLENDLSSAVLKTNVLQKINFSSKPIFIEGKKILREVGKSKLPPEILKKKKQGFVYPYNYWLNQESSLIKNLLNKKNNIYDLLNYSFVEKKIKKDLLDKSDRNFLWSVLSIDNFLKNFL